jgi:hypothetical protein
MGFRFSVGVVRVVRMGIGEGTAAARLRWLAGAAGRPAGSVVRLGRSGSLPRCSTRRSDHPPRHLPRGAGPQAVGPRRRRRPPRTCHVHLRTGAGPFSGAVAPRCRSEPLHELTARRRSRLWASGTAAHRPRPWPCAGCWTSRWWPRRWWAHATRRTCPTCRRAGRRLCLTMPRDCRVGLVIKCLRHVRSASLKSPRMQRLPHALARPVGQGSVGGGDGAGEGKGRGALSQSASDLYNRWLRLKPAGQPHWSCW